MDLAIAIIGAVAAVAAAVAALGSWNTARVANQTAGSVAAIEHDRRHDELTPEFQITCTVRDTAPDSADLSVVLAGGRVKTYDEVTIAILDEAGKEHWTRGLPDGVTHEEAQAFVWGPWEFNTGASEQVVSNRETRARPYSRASGKSWDLLSLTATRPGSWMSATTQDQWRAQWKGQPIRLLLTCECHRREPWFIQRDVEVTKKPRARVRMIEY